MNSARVFLSLTTQDNDYQRAQAAAATAAARRLGITLEIGYANGDAITQNGQILQVVQDRSRKFDCVVFEPVGTAMQQIARIAASNGIAWVVLNYNADYIGQLRGSASAPVFEVSEDQHAAGQIQGEQFTALLPRGGTVLYIQGPSENNAARDRTQGMQSALPTNIHITALRGQWTEESAARSVSSWLKLTVANRTKIDLVGAQNDVMAIGARKTLASMDSFQERERWRDMPYTGVDGLPKTGQAWVRDGSLTATIVVPPNTGQAIQMMASAMQGGGRVPERSYTTAQSVPALEKLVPRVVLA